VCRYVICCRVLEWCEHSANLKIRGVHDKIFNEMRRVCGRVSEDLRSYIVSYTCSLKHTHFSITAATYTGVCGRVCEILKCYILNHACSISCTHYPIAADCSTL